jgi:hypothetical protein
MNRENMTGFRIKSGMTIKTGLLRFARNDAGGGRNDRVGRRIV